MADSAITQRVKELGAQWEPYVIEQRRKFHAHPELGFQEVWTANEIGRELEEMGVPYERPIETAIVATIKGTAADAYHADGAPLRRIALRADIDALPVQEMTNAPYASKVEGKMHACGHDAHIAMMLGAVRILQEVRESLHGEVRVIFQPAEEISSGARALIEAGVLEGVDTIYGAHIWSDVKAGTISAESGPRMANTDWFRVDIDGASAHGAMPHKGVDALVVGAEMIDALQVIVSRDVSPFEPAVLTIGEFHAGVAKNVMAGTAYLSGTVRTFNPELRVQLCERMERMIRMVAEAFGAEATFDWTPGNAALYNDPACAARAQKSIAAVLGPQALARYEGTLSGEDFSEYLREVPGVFVFVGARNPEVGADYPQHSCFYSIDESALVGGSMVAAQYAHDYLAGE